MKETVTVENGFMKASEIKAAKSALSILTGCPEVLIKVYVQGNFKIPNMSKWNNELNLDYGWYEVTKIGSKYIKVFVPSEKKSFLAAASRTHYVNFNRKPGFRLVAEVFNTFSFRY